MATQEHTKVVRYCAKSAPILVALSEDGNFARRCGAEIDIQPKHLLASSLRMRSRYLDEDSLHYGWVQRKEEAFRFVSARGDGDGLLVLFECDHCIFRKLYKREPTETLELDSLAVVCIRRINLGA